MQNTQNKGKTRSTNPVNLFTRYLALKIYTKRDNVRGMYHNLKQLKPMYKRKPEYYFRLAKLAYRQKKWRQALGHIEIALHLTRDGTPQEYHKYKIDSLIQLGETRKAKGSINEYLLIFPEDADMWYTLTEQYTKLKQWGNVSNSLESYLSLNPKDSKASFELAECYYKLNDYLQAEKYYREAAKNRDQKIVGQSLAISFYKLGLMQLKNDGSKLATKSFDKAIKFDRELSSRRFGIGAFHEHYNQLEYAVEAYKQQVSQQQTNQKLYFKLASLLDKIHETEQALEYYQKALELDKVQAEWHYALARCYEEVGDYRNASIWYQSAINRTLDHSPEYCRKLGFVLDQLGDSRGSLNAYKEADMFNKPNSVEQKFYEDNITKQRVRYAISYEHYSVNDKVIFYESLGGARMMGNPYAVFEYIFNHEDFKNYTHVWVVNSFQVIPEEYKAKDNIIFVKKGSDAYNKYISSAKYLICNSTFLSYVVRKPDQFYLQTSHGIFYKTVGRDSTGSPLGVAGSTRNLLQATHIIVPNEYMAEKQPYSYSIKGINSGRIAKVGYPRIDVTLNASADFKHHIKSKLGIDMSKKMVLYAPTWRGSTKEANKFDSDKLIHDLKRLSEVDANIVFRGHTITNKLLKEVEMPRNIIVPQPDIQTNELLGVADILISDYSSVFFDFLVTERPVIHYLYDVDEYTKERGLNLGEDELPGTIAKDSGQLIAAVTEKLKNGEPDSHYLAGKDRFCPYDDGKTSERVVKWFFYGDDLEINFAESDKPATSYLCLGGMFTNKAGIPDLVSKLNHLQEKDGTMVSLMLKKKIMEDEDKRMIANELNKDINLLAHDNNMPITIEEAAAIAYFNSKGRYASKKMETALNRSFKRECRRLFGDSKFDEVINFEAGTNYWDALQNSLTDG